MENVVVAITIGERSKSEKYVDFFRQNGVTLSLGMYGQGTATKETLELLGIGNSEKFVIFSFMTMDKSKEVLKELEKKANMKTIGVGISFTIPMGSIDGIQTLKKLVSDVDANKEGNMKITILKEDQVCDKLIKNMLTMLSELEESYPENIKVSNK